MYQPLSSQLNGNMLTLYNKYDFTSFSEFDFEWCIRADGEIVKSDKLSLDTKPHTCDTVILDFEIPECKFGVYLDISMKDKNGYETAFRQHKLSDATKLDIDSNKAKITQNGEMTLITGDGFRCEFNTHYGYIERINGLVKTPMYLSVWRAPIDNDRHINEWYTANYDKVQNKVYSVDIKDNVITVKGSLAGVSRSPFFKYTAGYTFYADGRIDVVLDGEFDDENEFLPRLGFEFTTDEEKFKYFGYGPNESYIDMHHGSRVGMYESTAKDEYVDYIKPQEHGNHYNTKYLSMGDFEIISTNGMEINVSEYSAKELTKKAHNFELVKDGTTHVRIDYKVSGIGSASCGTTLCEQYKMNDKNVHFEFSILKK